MVPSDGRDIQPIAPAKTNPYDVAEYQEDERTKALIVLK